MTPLIASWPASVLSPNSRAHWRYVSEARRVQRMEGMALALTLPAVTRATLASMAQDYPFRRLAVQADFYPPDRKHRDQANCSHSIKGLVDGLADGLKVNDRCFKVNTDLKLETIRFGCVKVTIDVISAQEGAG